MRPALGWALPLLLLGGVSASTGADPTGGATCQVHASTCFSNAPHVIGTVLVADAGACCTLCEKNFQCRSYTAWAKDMDNPAALSCNLFSTVPSSAPAHGQCTSGVISGSRPKPLNFIFVFPDTLRAESHGGYADGDNHPIPRNVTPHLDAFAKSGTRFHQAHVMHTQCSPSRCTMLTGRYMHVLGHRTQTHLVQDYEMNYYRAMKEAGYYTAMYGKNDAFTNAAKNLSLSYWENDIGYGSGSQAVTFPNAGAFSFLSTGSNVSGADPSQGDYKGTLRVLDFLQHSPPEPFSLFLTSRGAHPPYGAPLEWHNKFSPEDVKAVGWKPRGRNIAGMPDYMQDANGIPHYRNLSSLDDDFFYKIQAVYLGMISYTDWIFGQLIEGLDKIEGGALAERTAVFFSSDHGDFGGDYGLVEKWPGSMADVLTRVPIYARIPGGVRGHVSQAPVATADILETMLDLANIEPTDWVRFGVSLVPQLQGGEGQLDRYVYSEGGFYYKNEQMNEAGECLSSCPTGLYCPRGQEESQPNGSPRATMIRNSTAKLVYRPTGISELYDLREDPRETVNLFERPEHAALQADLMRDLLDWLVLTSDVTPPKVDSRGGGVFPQALPSADPWAARGVRQPDTDAELELVFSQDFLRLNGIGEH